MKRFLTILTLIPILCSAQTHTVTPGTSWAIGDDITDTKLNQTANPIVAHIAGSITGDQIADGTITPDKLDDSVFLGHENKIINGDFGVWQGSLSTFVQTAASQFPNNDAAITFDRWVLLSDGNDIVDITRVTDAPANSLFALQAQVQTSARFGILQIIEQDDAASLLTNPISVQVKMKTITNEIIAMRMDVLAWDSTADSPTRDVVSVWAATPTLVANWFFETSGTNEFVITNSYQTFKIENITIATPNVNNLAVFIWSPNAESINDRILIDQVQTEVSATATVFEEKSRALVVQEVRRFFLVDGGSPEFPRLVAFNNTGGFIGSSARFAVSMIQSPVITVIGTWTMTNLDEAVPNVTSSSTGYQYSGTITSTGTGIIAPISGNGRIAFDANF